jgi:hypothetical protein
MLIPIVSLPFLPSFLLLPSFFPSPPFLASLGASLLAFLVQVMDLPSKEGLDGKNYSSVTF